MSECVWWNGSGQVAAACVSIWTSFEYSPAWSNDELSVVPSWVTQLINMSETEGSSDDGSPIVSNCATTRSSTIDERKYGNLGKESKNLLLTEKSFNCCQGEDYNPGDLQGGCMGGKFTMNSESIFHSKAKTFSTWVLKNKMLQDFFPTWPKIYK